MSGQLLITVLAASLLGSTHCAGMCGPFVLIIAGAKRDISFPFRLAAYHFGRLTTYVTLGVVAGALGASLNLASGLWGWQQTAAYVAGAAMLVTALVIVLRQLGLRLRHLPIPLRWMRLIHTGFRGVARWPAVPRSYVIGLLTTLLPCGWLYAFVIVAAGSADVLQASFIMTAFWVGTLPLLSLLGWTSATVAPRMRTVMPWVSVAACVILGISTIANRATLRLESLEQHFSTKGTAAERAQLVNTVKPPCCHDDE